LAATTKEDSSPKTNDTTNTSALVIVKLLLSYCFRNQMKKEENKV